MNVILTDICQGRCKYCFAKQTLGKASGHEMSLDDFYQVLRFAENSNDRTLKLLGGEPTLHTQIEGILQTVLQNDFFERTALFTNGLFERSLVRLLVHPKLSVVVNCNEPRDYFHEEWHKIVRNLEMISHDGGRISLSYNIYRTDFDPSFLLDLATHYNIKKIRYSIAKPSLSAATSHIRYEEHPIVAEPLVDFILKCFDKGIIAEMDCGVPVCMFTDEQVGRIIKRMPKGLRMQPCSPVVDIGPDLQAWRCFPFSEVYRTSIHGFDNLHGLKRHFARHIDVFKWMVHHESKCCKCDLKLAKVCQGGCLAYVGKEIISLSKALLRE